MMTEKLAAGHLDDAWIHIDETDDPEFFIRFLDASRARALAFARSHPEAAFAHLALRPGLSVLDCGCGTGDMLALIARQTAPGEALGGDLSPRMVQEARRRAASAGVDNLQFEVMDAQALTSADERFDRVLASQLLVHVPDPRQALREICRVTARQGMVALADMDWDTLVLGASDKALGRRFTRLFSDGVRNGVVVREYAGWLRAEGFTNVRTTAQQLLFEDWSFSKAWIFDSALPSFIAKGAMSPAEAHALEADLSARSAAGYFLAAATYYTVTAQRP